jgi:hypothetical protein
VFRTHTRNKNTRVRILNSCFALEHRYVRSTPSPTHFRTYVYTRRVRPTPSPTHFRTHIGTTLSTTPSKQGYINAT